MQLDPLVKPRSFAIVGATDRVGPARSVIESLGAIGFAGPIYPVNPKYQTVRNLVCYPTLTDLPEAPDVVVFSIRKPLLPEQVRLAVKRGARAAVIYDAGFAELGEDGVREQAEIADLCREAGMPVCGPNCMGILNPTAHSTTYKQTVMDPSGLAGNVGIVSQRGITSHTGGLAGESRVFSEVLKAHRAIEVSDLDEMSEVLAVCQGERWPRGRGISVITGSGGLAEMILDNATAAGLDLPALSPAERAEAERVIGRITGDGNPFDAWGNGDYAVNLPHAMSVVNDSERIAAIVYCADTGNEGQLGHPGRVLENVKMLVEAAQRSHKPHYLMSSRPGVVNVRQAKALREAGLVQIGGTRQGLGAIDSVARYMMEQKPVRTSANRRGPQLADLIAARPGRRAINEYDSKRLLSGFGVPVTREARVATIAEATSAARELSYPVVLKALSDDIAHKTELGLVAVGLKNGEELAHAFARLSERLDRLDPPPSERAFLVQEFVADGVELFAGVSRDPDFGLSLAVGMGGTAIEVTRDFALRMLPLREGDAEAMIAEVRGAALLASVRGRPAADVGSVVACLEGFEDFARQNGDVLDEVFVHPIKAMPQGGCCVVEEAFIVARAPARG